MGERSLLALKVFGTLLYIAGFGLFLHTCVTSHYGGF